MVTAFHKKIGTETLGEIRKPAMGREDLRNKLEDLYLRREIIISEVFSLWAENNQKSQFPKS
jgi:hypothetical protein